MLVSQTSFGRETGGNVTKCQLFSQANKSLNPRGVKLWASIGKSFLDSCLYNQKIRLKLISQDSFEHWFICYYLLFCDCSGS